MDKNQVFVALYHHIFRQGKGRNHYPIWRGLPVIKMPNDLILYAQVIQALRPDLLIETGTRFGGSALFFADMMDIVGSGRVVTVDISSTHTPAHPRVTYITGRSTSDEVLDRMAQEAAGKRTMVVLDSAHNRRHVKRELVYYGRLVSPGSYMVVEDCFGEMGAKCGPGEAVDWFLPRTKSFVLDPVDEQFMAGVTRGGWLRKA